MKQNIMLLLLAFIATVAVIHSTKSNGLPTPVHTEGVSRTGVLSVESYTRQLQQYMLDRGIVWVKVEGELVELTADGRDGPKTDAAYCMLMGIESIKRAK